MSGSAAPPILTMVIQRTHNVLAWPMPLSVDIYFFSFRQIALMALLLKYGVNIVEIPKSKNLAPYICHLVTVEYLVKVFFRNLGIMKEYIESIVLKCGVMTILETSYLICFCREYLLATGIQ